LLGNQVGRGATEGLSARSVDTRIFTSELRTMIDIVDRHSRWHAQGVRPDRDFDRSFLIQHEHFHADQASYNIGDAFKAQRTPYADASLLACAVAMPPIEKSCTSTMSPRVRELASQIAGPRRNQFQVKYIRRHGGAAACLPINLGWTPAGRNHLRDRQLGLCVLVDDVLRRLTKASRLASKLRSWLGFRDLSTHLNLESWLEHIRVPLLDVLLSGKIREARVFDVRYAERLINQSDNKQVDIDTISLVTDLTLLIDQFGPTIEMLNTGPLSRSDERERNP
jgi:hypothetical protein